MGDDLDMNITLYSSREVKALFRSNLKKVTASVTIEEPSVSHPIVKDNDTCESLPNSALINIHDSFDLNLDSEDSLCKDSLDPVQFNSPKKNDIGESSLKQSNDDVQFCGEFAYSKANYSSDEDIPLDTRLNKLIKSSRRLTRSTAKRFNGKEVSDINLDDMLIEDASSMGIILYNSKRKNQNSNKDTSDSHLHDKRNRRRSKRKTRQTINVEDECAVTQKMVFTAHETSKWGTAFSNDELMVQEVVELSDTETEINEVVTVKVIWKSVSVEKFSVRKFQKLSFLFDHFAKLESVPVNQIHLTLRGIVILPSDTPDSLNLKIYEFIDGGVLSESTTVSMYSNPKTNNISTKDDNSITLKFQDTSRKLICLTMKVTEKMKIIMLKCAEQFDLRLDQLRFILDGDIINPEDTPVGLDLEGGEVIDIRKTI